MLKRLAAVIVAAACALCAPHAAVSAESGQETVLHSFGGPDGAGPLTGLVSDRRGVLYGSTAFGGTAGGGSVFMLTPGKHGYTERAIYDFRGGSDGATPLGLVLAGGGTLYGVTFIGGNSGNGGNGWGTVFRLVPGKAGYTKTTLYRFRGGTDAWEPVGAPVLDRAGNIYGVGSFGGFMNDGAVYKLAPSGSGYTESIVYGFPGDAGGQLPAGGLTIDGHDSLFGTTSFGGHVEEGPCDGGCGIVFKLAPFASGYVESIVHTFTGSDGNEPSGTLAIDGRTGAIFGTTIYGGASQDGVVFKLTPAGSSYGESVLHNFNAKADGFYPEGQPLLGRGGVVYGTASLGGGGCHGIGCGVVFGLTPSGPGYTFKVIYDFRSPINGAEPTWSGVVAGAGGGLYGTTRSGGTAKACADGGPGGARGCGTVFELVP